MKQELKSPPKLAPPGAGIPKPARFMLRYVLLPFWSLSMNREDSRDAFNRENARILQAIQRRTPAELEKKILVPPFCSNYDILNFY